MVEKKQRIRRKAGQIFQVPLRDGTFGYGQTTSYNCAFFDLRDQGEVEDLKSIIQKPILFRVGVANYAITEGIWPVVGILPVADFLEEEEDPFTFDIRKKQYLIWKSGTERIPATPEEIYNLECFASWDPEHIEQRLKDHFEGRPNFDVEYFRNQHNPNFERDIEKFYQQYGYDFKLNNG
jgi:hypothetical protein